MFTEIYCVEFMHIQEDTVKSCIFSQCWPRSKSFKFTVQLLTSMWEWTHNHLHKSLNSFLAIYFKGLATSESGIT